MPCLRFFIGVFIVVILSASLLAEEKLSLQERQRAMYDRLDEITGDFEELYLNPDLEKLGKAIQLLRDSESLFPESDQSSYERYLYGRINYFSLAANNTKDAQEKNALFDECEQAAKKVAEPDERNYLLEWINDARQYGYRQDEMRTIEAALKISKPLLRDEALSVVAQNLSRQTPPDFAEALRAARMISDDDAINRELCYSIIAVRQARAGLFEDAETTYRLITEEVFEKLETLLTFAVIHEQYGDLEAAKRRIDEVFEIGDQAKDGTFTPQFFRYCYSGLVQLKTPDLANYLYGKMGVMRDELAPEYQDIQNGLTFAKAASHLGNREAARVLFQSVRSQILDDEEKWGYFDNVYRKNLIAAAYEAGFDTAAAKELQDFVALIQTERMQFPGLDKTPSSCLRGLVAHHLAAHGRFAEAVATAKVIPDEKERFEAYDWIVHEIRFRLRNDDTDDRVQMDPPRKRFSSRQEILDIAEMLTDEPDGKSLESYRARIRRLAERMP